jgi:hypothetical protein
MKATAFSSIVPRRAAGGHSVLVGCALLLVSCTDLPVLDDVPDEPPTGAVLYPSGCDPIVPDSCGFPFPSDVWSIPDASTETGRRIAIPSGVIPPNRSGDTTNTSVLSESDGFSPGASMLTCMPGATATGLANPQQIERSTLDASPTIVVDAETGERIPHWAEIDVASDPSGKPGAFIIRPAVRLRDATRYVVAVRRVVDEDGLRLAPSPAFRAIRDGSGFPGDATIEGRRAHYEDVFATLATAGVPRSDLQIAWDFTTSSQANNTRRLLHMRDAALAEIEENGCPEYTIDDVSQPFLSHTALKIEGTITVPMYLDQVESGGVMTIGENGLPVRQGSAAFPFILEIPNAAEDAPVPVVQYGHGLLTSMEEVSIFRVTADNHGAAYFAMNNLGLYEADVGTIAGIIASGDLSGFRMVPDGGQQAALNYIVAARAIECGIAHDARTFIDGSPTIDPSRFYYMGSSQGGIWGAMLMAVSPDLERGALFVPGQSYDMMLLRSKDFNRFLYLFRIFYEDRVRFPVVTNIAQMLWDRSEGNGYAEHITRDPLPGSSVHQVVLFEGLSDHSVPNVATELLARTIGAPQLEPNPGPVWGIPSAEGPIDGSALVRIDYGRDPAPITNVPAAGGGIDPHELTILHTTARAMAFGFFETGLVTNLCDGSCDSN